MDTFTVLSEEATPSLEARSEIIHGFARAVLAITRSVVARRISDGARLGLSDTEVRAMGRIAEGGGLSAGRLGELLNLTTGSVTALIDRLVTAGMVERHRNQTDKRAIVLQLTEQGELGMTTLYTDFQVLLAEAAADLASDDIELLSAMMMKLAPTIAPSS